MSPDHLYRTDRDPPGFTDRLYAHPFEIILAYGGAIGGIVALFAALSDEAVPSKSLEELPESLVGVIGVLLIFGAAGVLFGLFDTSKDLMVGWKKERGGIILSMGGWAGYGIAVLGIYPESILSWGLPLLTTVALYLRLRAIGRVRDSLRKFTL